MKYLLLLMILIGCGAEDQNDDSASLATDDQSILNSLDGRYYTECANNYPISSKHLLKIQDGLFELESNLFDAENCYGTKIITSLLTRKFSISGKSEEFTNGYKMLYEGSATQLVKFLTEIDVLDANYYSAYGYSDWKINEFKPVNGVNYDPSEPYVESKAKGNVVKINEDKSIELGDVMGPLDEDDYPITLSNFKFLKQ